MRFSAILVLALAGLTITASAQKPQKTRTKPSHSEEREAGQKSARVGKEPAAGRSSAAQELRRVEQSSAKVSGARRAEGAKAARSNPVLKAQKKDGNPPIRFSATGGSGKSSGKSGDALKGRLRHKGKR